MAASTRQIGFVALASLVALRVGIGLHFYAEGAKKFQDPQPYSAGFFSSAKGRMAPLFHGLVWDSQGLARLNEDKTRRIWQQYHLHAAGHYGYNKQQAERAEEIFERRFDQYQQWLDDNATEVAEYKLGVERLAAYQRDTARVQVASLRGQLSKMESDLQRQRGDLMPVIDQVTRGYEEDLYRLATPAQRSAGRLALPRPGRRAVDSESIDAFVRWFDIGIGVLLIVGLFTRVAAVAGAVFLASVIATQWPGAPGALPVWPQFIELLGMVVLAATGAGRFAGFDAVLGSLRHWCCPPNRGDQS